MTPRRRTRFHSLTRRLDARLQALPRVVQVAGGIALVMVLAVVNSLLPNEVSFSVFYLIPVSLLAWYAGRGPALAASLLAATCWFFVTYDSPSDHLATWIPYWNATVRLIFLSVDGLLVHALRRAMDAERSLARTDPLTGLPNSRAFQALTAHEVQQTRRHRQALTIGYVDADNFKAVNDACGHAAGDRVLEVIGATMRGTLRETDIAARLGGDEFAVLLPRTDDREAALVLEKLRSSLLHAMAGLDSPVTFSIGAVSCATPPGEPEILLRQADEAMYTAKQAGKNRVMVTRVPGDPASGSGAP